MSHNSFFFPDTFYYDRHVTTFVFLVEIIILLSINILERCLGVPSVVEAVSKMPLPDHLNYIYVLS